ncbi:S-layer homology domain-containing protein [Cohnella abietis]|uniref:SLH domain-containing protein n=1 Tax=Cohnella abietis TaxID=2507935 RepID=A0A3T1DES6_9BACL|nr:S-layer homology domain-containing protein [Cohnella abietis]BBI36630.1 hypothetical protein KCTCHS21_60290 [Cohnella abietis]
MRKLGKKSLFIILTILLGLGAVVPEGIFGSSKAFAANEFLGSGTSSSPYLIGTADQLNQIRGNYLDKNLYFKLTKNIDLSTSSYKDDWTPIGNDRRSPFSGNFDGNGFVINGLKIDSNGNNLGLFGLTNTESVITNMKLENVDVTGNNYVGGLVGANKGKVSNSYVTGKVTGKDGVGGLVGDNGVTITNVSATIDNSYANVSVNGSSYASGGLAGKNKGSINYSYATGDVHGDYAVGGLVGENDGTISYSYATGEMIEGQSIGGLVGSNSTDSYINNSFATGKVNGTFSTGGLTGFNFGSISKSYSTGDVIGLQHVGGLVSNLEVKGIIRDSFTTGNVSGYSFVGGLIGFAYSDSEGSYSNSYTSGNVSGDLAPIGPLTSNGEGNNIGSISLDENMKGPVDGWDFNTLWGIDPLRNGGYPYLQDFLFQLKYDGNGNTGGTVPIDSILYLPGETASVYAGSLNLVRTGYTFIGWNTQENGNGKSYSGSFEIMPYTTLYAQWAAQSSSATLTSGIGIVSTGGTTTETITNIPYGTTLAILKEEITPATNATFEIFDADGVNVATNLTSGKKVIVTAADGITKVTYIVSVIANSANDITAFSLAEQTGAATINKTAHTVVIQVARATNVTNLKPTFTLSPEASARVGTVDQVSGSSANNFTTPVTYIVKAGDGSSQNWTVTVTKSSEKDITAFSLSTVTLTKAATISTIDHTVDVEVVYGIPLTSLSNLKATFSLSPEASAKIGTVNQVSGTTANDFRTPVKYLVTAADGSVQEWIVSVSIESSNAKDITAFSFSSQTKPATINTTAHTVAIEVKYGTNVTNLIATFTLSPASAARVNGTSQKSGTTANNFTNPVTYIVKAENGTTRNWLVTVTVAPPSSANDITAFSFVAQSKPATINTTTNTVTIEVKNGTNPNGLKATFTLSAGASAQVGTTAQVSGTTTNDFTSPVTYIVTAQDGTTKAYTVTVTEASSSAKDVTSFGFAELTPPVAGAINGTNITLTVPHGTDVRESVATFTLSAGASAQVGTTAQVSGATRNDFTSPVTYTVTAQDGTTKAYTVTVTEASSSAKDVTSFGFAELTPPVAGTINGTNISLIVPHGTDVRGLVATFTLSAGASAKVGTTTQVSGVTKNDFTSPVTYIVTAQDGTTKAYTVTVTAAPSSAKDVTAFGFAELTPPVLGTINGTNIAITVPHGTDVRELVATFALSAGASAQVGTTAQVSRTTKNDFTSPVTYIVIAQDGTKQNWVVTVTHSAALSHVATITSTIGTVTVGGTGNESISNIPYGTTIAALKAAITQAAGATFEIYDADGTIVATTLISGNKVIVVAQDGTTKVTYTVSVNAAPPSYGGGFTFPSEQDVSSTDGKLTVPAGKAGEVSLEKEIFVSIPANATDKELKITITKLTDTQNLLTKNEVLVTAIYEIMKNFRENFNNPVSISFAFDPASLKSGQTAAVFYYDEVKKSWIEVIGGLITGNQITVKVNHFAKFAVFATGQSLNEQEHPGPTKHLSDIDGHWAETAIKQAIESGIVTGYLDGTFRPNRIVTRAEFTVMLMNTLKPQGSDTSASLAFTDVDKIGSWAKGAVAQAVQAGYIKGNADGSFRPDAVITRAEMAMIIANATGLSLEANSSTDFVDDKAIPAWAKGAVSAVRKFGFINGKGANKFEPDAGTTRAEAVTVLLKVLAQKSR